jgi:hypothetical protein
MCLNKTYSEVRVGKYLSDTFSVQNDLKQGYALSPLIFKFYLRICHEESPRILIRFGTEWHTSAVGLC